VLTPPGWSYPQPIRLLCVALLLGACGGDSLSLPPDGQPATITIKDGDDQNGRVGEPLAKPLLVQVTDSRGRPVEGATVAFEFNGAGPGASVVPQEKTTNGDGMADAVLVLGTTIGLQTGRARVMTGGASSPIQASFTATALPENANSMAAVAGQDQTGHVGQPLIDRLVVEVTDGFGNPVAGVPISWVAVGGGGVSEAVVPTGADGRSRVDRTLGPAVGPQTTLASADSLAGSPVTFFHTAVAGDASFLVIVSGNDQTAEAGTLLPQELVVQLIDAEGNGVAGTAVTWVAAVGGGSPAPENTTTDAEGRTSTRWTLGQALGEQRLDAVVSGVDVASLHAIATTGAPASLFIQTQPSASARNGVPLARQPVVQLRDARGNEVATAGVQVTAGLGGGGELEGATRQTTDASGRARFDDLAISGAPGTRTLVFTATGYAQVTSDEIDLQAIGTSTTVTDDSPDPSVAGAAFTVRFQVTSEGPTPSGTVTVTDGVQSCSGSLVGGVGSCDLSLTTVGQRTLTASYSGIPGLFGSSDTEGHAVSPQPSSNEAPRADFEWQCQGLTCQFTDTSTDDDGTVTTWNWDFGDTGSSTQQSPTHMFPAAGTYTVTLTATDDDLAPDSHSQQVRVEAPPPENQSPTAEFTWQCKDLDCDFDDQSSDGDGRIETRAWDFGDGNSSDARNPDHKYGTSGTYTVRLTVTDNDGASAAAEQVVTVTAPNQPPHAEFTSTCTNLDCQFTDQSTDPDGGITSWNWDFDDGTGSTEQNPTHSFGSTGTYKVRLTVTDGGGETRSKDHDVHVSAANQPPSAAFTSPSCAVNEGCQFSDQSTDGDGSINSQTWDFGDGNSANGSNPSHTYLAAGNFNVTLTVTDDDGATNSVTHVVTVADAPAPTSLGFRTEPPDRIKPGQRLKPEPEVELRDAGGSSIEIEGVIINAAISGGGGTLFGTLSRSTDSNGRAKFNDLSIDGAVGSTVTLAFTAAGLAPLDSQLILIAGD
jgi:PKD repeat protein